MNESTYGVATLIKALRAGAEGVLAVLNEAAAEPHLDGETATQQEPANGLIEYDPLTDPVPLPQDPSRTASRAEQRMAHLTYLGAIARINASEGRGANRKEVTKYAIKAGYNDGKAVNGWNARPENPRAINNLNGARYLNAGGHSYLPELAAELGLKIKGDITPLPIPE